MNRIRTVPGESLNLQVRMNKAFEDYFAVTNELRSDVEMFLDVIESGLIKDSDIRWKRNFVRTLVALIEGHSYMLRQIAATELECKIIQGYPQALSKKEQKALTSGDDFSLPERIKYTLSASYKVWGLPLPDFGKTDWKNAQEGLDWRNDLTHPKTPADLERNSDSWKRIDSGLIWLLKLHFDFPQHLHEWNTINSA